MANYQEVTVTGQSWIRAAQVIINNPLNGVPEVTFVEERVVSTSEGVQKTRVSSVDESMHDTTTRLDIYDPLTGLKTGATASYGDVYNMLFSLYMTLANKRDAQ